MMLCDETRGHFVPVAQGKPQTKPQQHLAATQGVVVIAREEPEAAGHVPESLANVKIPKNKNAKRRFIASIHENIDQYARGSAFKKSGRPMPSDLAMSIRKIR